MGSGVTPSQVNMSRRRGGAAGGSSQGSSSATTTHIFGHCPAEDQVRALQAEVQRLRYLEDEVQRLSQLVGSSSKGKGSMPPSDMDSYDDEEDDD
ncbi:hypothetical protein LINPERHAP1_LOCUS30691 [Linum perenne]